MNLTKLTLKRPVSVILVVLALVVFGIGSIFTSPIELTPDMEMPMLIVATTYPGAGPEDVEKLVTKEIESAVSTLSGVKNVQSVSQENMSMVVLEMEYGTDMNVAHADLQQKVTTYASFLPDDASDPIIIEMDINAMPTVMLSATATGDLNLLNYIDENIVPEFEKLSGVASVDVYGGQQDYISVQLMDDRMKQYGLDMSSVVSVLSTADFSIPSGTAERGSQDLTIKSGVRYTSADSLKNVPIPLRNGNVIHLSDVATVFETTKKAESLSRYNGNETLTLSVTKRQSASTLDVSKSVLRQMDQINRDELGVKLEVINDSSEQIVDAVSTVASTLVLGVLLSMFVLFLFFGDFKASLIVGSSMPVSLLFTFVLMKMMGFSINLLSLGGLVIGVGMMVDNSIVVLESCFRQRAGQQSYRTAALEGAKFVTSSIIASTITTIVVFLPISLMEGMSGQLFKQLGFTIIFSLTASLICALMVIPLAFTFFKPKEKTEAPVSKLVRKTEIAYGNLMRRLLRYKKSVVAFSLLLLVGSVALIPLLNIELIPSIDQGTVSVSVEAKPGLKLEEINKLIFSMEDMVKNHPDVERYTMTSGGGGMSSMMGGGGSASFTAYLRSDREMTTNEIVEEWRRQTRNLINCEVSVSSSSGMSSMMSGGSSAQISLQGNDYDQIKAASKQVEAMMYENPGVVKVSSTITQGNPQAEIMVDPLLAAGVGMTPQQVAGTLNMVLSGKEAFTLSSNGEEYSVRVEYPEGRYQTVDDLAGLVLTSPTGKQVPLMDIATIYYSDSPQLIQRKNNQYIVTVTGDLSEATKFTAKDEITKAAATMSFPRGVSLAKSDMDVRMVEEFTSLLTAIAAAVLLVFLVMAMQFESPRFSLMVMICIPFSLVGSFGLMFLSGVTLSMPSLMGFLMLVGIVVNNGILFVDTTNQYRASMDIETALVMAGRSRLRPILMTTLTTVLSMVPMAFNLGNGTEIMQGMAIVIIGGLCASTLLTLLLLPTFYLIFARKKAKKDRDPEPEQQIADEGLMY
ncbi:efflux RND transporter permease subunit [Anaerotruncus rubiinfantis]|uniref:efflux RND transporter permease subunit n=1 Tax=Anaerotruncus rubiinfantis TaxID=1720200 RepID=UPI000830AF4E|nr:efflux RND transporter permease subunit [Anaerotruncus rubiinfantis]